MILPFHPQPKHDEILSSWMVRLALDNGYLLHTFYRQILQYNGAIWNRDIDRRPALALLQLLSSQTGQETQRIRDLALLFYEGIFFEAIPLIGNTAWVLPLGIFHRSRRRNGMQYCPLCLKSDTTPYFRKRWRLAIHVICEIHQCKMEDQCPSCFAPIAFHRHGIGRDQIIENLVIAQCFRCGFDLRSKLPEFCHCADRKTFQRFQALITAWESGNWDCGINTPACSVPFYQGIRVLINLIYGRHGHRIRPHLSMRSGLSIPSSVETNHREFEYLSVSDRIQILLAIAWVIGDWPDRFVEICLNGRLTRSRISDNVGMLPFWLATSINRFLDCRPYFPSVEELEGAAKLLRSRGLEIRPVTLAKVIGVSSESVSTVLKNQKMRLCEQLKSSETII